MQLDAAFHHGIDRALLGALTLSPLLGFGEKPCPMLLVILQLALSRHSCLLGYQESGFGPRPRDFMVGADALVFFGGLAFGFLASRVLRFWPLAMKLLLESRRQPLPGRHRPATIGQRKA